MVRDRDGRLKRIPWQCIASVCVVGMHCWEILVVSRSVECDLSVLSYTSFFLTVYYAVLFFIGDVSFCCIL